MKTAFVIRDIPDLDHLTPVIFKFLTLKKEIVILNYEINLNLQNDFRISFLKKKFGKLNIINIYSFLDQGLIYNFLSRVFSIKNNEINFKNLKSEIKFNFDFFKKFIIAFIKKLFFKRNSYLESIFFNKKWIKKIFEKLQIKSVIIDDSSYLIYKKAQNIVEVCREENLKIHLFPHTCFINDRKEDYEDIKKNLSKLKNFPNIITNSNFRKKKLIETGIKEKNILVYGSGRFSPEWLNIFQEITNCDPNKVISKTKVLYFEGVYNDQSKEKKLINYLSNLDNFDLIIKTHPRGIFSKKQIENIKKTNFNIDLTTPSTKLIFDADIIIGTFSSILVDAFVLNKTVIYPKFLINENQIEILYAGKDFTIDCETNEEVKNAISKFNEKKLVINENNLENFLNDFVYGNRNKHNILNDYVELLKPN